VLDAGCGNGSLSRGINRFGCEVVAADVSGSVFPAYRHFSQLGNGRTHFLQADLTRHPFRSESVDIVYSSGVLHHNPNTFDALRSVLRTLKPGGTVYIWVYEPIPGVRHRLKGIFRSLVAPLPAPVKQAIMYLWLPQAMLRQHLRTLLGRNEPQDRLKWRERLVLLMDHYTPRYRWEHTQQEVHGWYRSLGLEAIRTTEEREWGFGVMARKPS
jgi:SAM-dependent methyltransferase